MSRQLSRGSAGEYQADERAGIARPKFQDEAGQLLVIGHLDDQGKIETPLRHIDSLDLTTQVFSKLFRRIQPLRRLLYILDSLIRPVEEHQISIHGALL